MRTTAERIEQIWLLWYGRARARDLCRAYDLEPAALRALLAAEVAAYERWRITEALDVLHVVCVGCGARTGPAIGMRVVETRALCCLCALDHELAEVAR